MCHQVGIAISLRLTFPIVDNLLEHQRESSFLKGCVEIVIFRNQSDKQIGMTHLIFIRKSYTETRIAEFPSERLDAAMQIGAINVCEHFFSDFVHRTILARGAGCRRRGIRVVFHLGVSPPSGIIVLSASRGNADIPLTLAHRDFVSPYIQYSAEVPLGSFASKSIVNSVRADIHEIHDFFLYPYDNPV